MSVHSSRTRRFRPALERLEDRATPATLTVTTLGPGPGSLPAVLALANDGDTIVWDPSLAGTSVLTSELPIPKSVAFQGPGSGQITYSGGLVTRVFSVPAGKTVAISGLTIADGLAFGRSEGGGIANFGTLVLRDCTVTDCATFKGGGIENRGTLTVVDSTFSGNSAGIDGGAIANDGTLTVSGCTFTGNYAGGGAGISNDAGVLTVVNSTFTGNTAGNASNGGGIDAEFGTAVVRAATIVGNSAATAGGGLFVSASATVTLQDTIVALNTLAGGGASDIAGLLVAGSSYNLIGTGGAGGLVDGVNGNQVGVIDPMLGPLQDNGGPTYTVELLAGSPALGAGDPGLLGLNDQRGVARTGGVNVGAYQASASAFLLTAPVGVRGVPFDVGVTAVDAYGKVAVGYTGTVHFYSTDPFAQLPDDYTFTTANAGMATFVGVVLYTPGPQTLTLVDTTDPTISGSLDI